MAGSLVRLDGLTELEKHVEQLLAVPETELDAELFDKVQLQLTPASAEPLVHFLLPSLNKLLLLTQHDPTVPASFIAKLIQPLSFKDILQLASEETLTLAAESPHPAVNLLLLEILAKAQSPSDVAVISLMQPFLLQFIRRWLSAPDVSVGHKATEILAQLLEIDCPKRKAGTLTLEMNGGKTELRAEPTGHGVLWRRIISDPDIYSSLFKLCRDWPDYSPQDDIQKTLGQARLLRILPRLAVLDIELLSMPLPRGLAGNPALQSVENGLLYWASTSMIDREDFLMYVTYMDYVAELIKRFSGFGDFDTVELNQQQMWIFVDLVKGMWDRDPAVKEVIEQLQQSEQARSEKCDNFLSHLMLQVASQESKH